MSSSTPDQDALSQEANQRYWESDESVNQIGEALGLSKGMLYNLLEPLAAGLPCPSCGEEMVFPNRTARDKGFLECPECGLEEEEASVQAFWEEEGSGSLIMHPTRLVRRAGEAMQKAVDTGRDRVESMTPRSRIIAGTALLGAAAGLFLGNYLRKR
jgi:hypothetical protein